MQINWESDFFSTAYDKILVSQSQIQIFLRFFYYNPHATNLCFIHTTINISYTTVVLPIQIVCYILIPHTR